MAASKALLISPSLKSDFSDFGGDGCGKRDKRLFSLFRIGDKRLGEESSNFSLKSFASFEEWTPSTCRFKFPES